MSDMHTMVLALIERLSALETEYQEAEATIQSLGTKVDALETYSVNQDHAIREQEKDIVTLKLQIAGLHDRLMNCVIGPVSTVSGSVSDGAS